MKKIITVVVAALVAVTVLAGCSAPAAPAAPSASAVPVASVEPADGGQQVINPLKKYDSVEEMAKATGIPMSLPNSAELVRVQSIDGNMNEVVFTVADGSQFTYRKVKSDFADVNGKDDVSGYYIEWADTHEATTPGGVTVTVKTGDSENSGSGIAVWNDGEHKYAVVMDKGYDEGILLAAVDSVK